MRGLRFGQHACLVLTLCVWGVCMATYIDQCIQDWCLHDQVDVHVTEFTCAYIVYEYLYTNELIRWRSGQLITPYTVILPSLSVCSWVYAHLSMGVCVHVCVPLCILALIPHTKAWECGCVDARICMFVYLWVPLIGKIFSVEILTQSRPTVKI